jgi:hypothetical protein
MTQHDEVIAREFKALTTSGKVRFLMELNGQDTTTMSQLLGISRQSFSTQLNHRDWKVERLKKVAEILNVPPAILL